MTQFTPGSFLLKKYVQGFYMRLPFQLATPPGFHATHIPKGNLVMIYEIIYSMYGLRTVYVYYGIRNHVYVLMVYKTIN